MVSYIFFKTFHFISPLNDENLFKTLSKSFFLSTTVLVLSVVTITTILFSSTFIILSVFADYANQQTESNFDLLKVPTQSFDSSSIDKFSSFKDFYSKDQYPDVNIQKTECRNINLNLNGINNEIYQESKVTNDDQGSTINPISKGIEIFTDRSFNIDSGIHIYTFI